VLEPAGIIVFQVAVVKALADLLHSQAVVAVELRHPAAAAAGVITVPVA